MDKTENIDSESLYSSLDKAMWITKHSRYIASDRLRKKHLLSVYTISILSVYVIVLSLLVRYGFVPRNSNFYELISVISAIFILVLSLAESSKNYNVASERLFSSGNEIRDLLDELKKYKNDSEYDVSAIEKLSKKYSHVLKECGENHETVDYHLFKAQRVSDFNDMNMYYSLIYRGKFYLNIYWFYFVLMFLPPLLFWKIV